MHQYPKKFKNTLCRGKTGKQPLGNIESLGTGRIKKVFTEDIDMIELFTCSCDSGRDCQYFDSVCHPRSDVCGGLPLSFASFIPILVGIFAMGMMMKQGNSKMDAYYESAAVMNNTIIEYVNGMEVVKVFNKDGDSYKRFR